MAKRIAVLLSGCGMFDGSDVHEAVLTLLALERAGAVAVCAAPDKMQHHVLNHLNQEEAIEQRNVLVESARIARGDICDLKHIRAEGIDGLIVPGGIGAAKNLSDFALKGPEALVDPQVEFLLKALLTLGKPIGAIGIATATMVKALSGQAIEVTIGKDPGTAAAIENMGAVHHACRMGQVHVDATHKIITTPAYGQGSSINGLAKGIELLVENILDLID